MNSADSDRFENFRRERKRRRADAGPLRPMGKNEAVLRQIEEAEQREVRNQRLTREVKDFFEEATRTAASIVSQVAQSAEQEQQVAVTREMSEFLTATIQRAQMFVQMMQFSANAGIAQQDLEANLHNLVGERLDAFRWEGNSEVSDPHIGLDPFKVADGGPQSAAPPSQPQAFHPGIDSVEEIDLPPEEDEHLAAEFASGEDDVFGADVQHSALESWFAGLAADHQRLKEVLKVLVHYQAMSRDEARAIWAEVRS